MNVWFIVGDRHVLFICGDIVHHQSLDQYLSKLVSLSRANQKIVSEIILAYHFFNIDDELSGIEKHIVVNVKIVDILNESTETNATVDGAVFNLSHLIDRSFI